MKNRVFGGGVLLTLFTALALTSCASGPEQISAEGQTGEFAYLPEGGQVYFYANINQTRPLLDQLVLKNINMKDIGRILDRIDFIGGALFPPESPQRIFVRGWKQKGRIQGAAILSLNSGWKKTRSPASGGVYWRSAQYGLSAAINAEHAFVSDQDPYIEFTMVSMPERLEEFRRNALMLGWVEKAGLPLNRFLSSLGIPLQVPTNRILFGIYESAESTVNVPYYEVAIRIETASVTQAKALATLVAMIRGFVENQNAHINEDIAELLKPLLVNPPSLSDTDLVIRTGPIDAQGIALLFNHFSLYSQ